jgi:hypothetical protein
MKLRSAFPSTVLVLGALAGGAPPALADQTPACVRWWGQTVHMGVGYNHVVGIENTCERTAVCSVSTDVAPDPIQATVSPKQKVELTTFRGSPSSVFRPKVECKLQ